MSYVVMDSWATEDVASIAPDLNEWQQCAVLLLACVAEHNAELGINWDVLTNKKLGYWTHRGFCGMIGPWRRNLGSGFRGGPWRTRGYWWSMRSRMACTPMMRRVSSSAGGPRSLVG
jgi:hypothetical protein